LLTYLQRGCLLYKLIDKYKNKNKNRTKNIKKQGNNDKKKKSTGQVFNIVFL